MRKGNFIIVYVTAKNLAQAKRIAQKLIQGKAAACVNVVPNVQSIYQWNGKIESSNEVLLIIKSKKNLFENIVEIVKKNHSYDLPEIIAIPIVDGSKDYLNWITESTKK